MGWGVGVVVKKLNEPERLGWGWVGGWGDEEVK